MFAGYFIRSLYLFIYFLRRFLAGSPRQRVAPLLGPEQPLPTPPPRPPAMRDRLPHRELRSLLFTNREWVLLRLTEFRSVSAVSRGLRFVVLIREDQKVYNNWRMSSQRQYFLLSYLKLRANKVNIVGQQLPPLLANKDVTCCVRLHTLLRVFVQSLKQAKILAQCKRAQHCWELFSQLKNPECWSGRGLNQRPHARQPRAYPIELTGRRLNKSLCIYSFYARSSYLSYIQIVGETSYERR